MEQPHSLCVLEMYSSLIAGRKWYSREVDALHLSHSAGGSVAAARRLHPLRCLQPQPARVPLCGLPCSLKARWPGCARRMPGPMEQCARLPLPVMLPPPAWLAVPCAEAAALPASTASAAAPSRCPLPVHAGSSAQHTHHASARGCGAELTAHCQHAAALHHHCRCTSSIPTRSHHARHCMLNQKPMHAGAKEPGPLRFVGLPRQAARHAYGTAAPPNRGAPGMCAEATLAIDAAAHLRRPCEHIAPQRPPVAQPCRCHPKKHCNQRLCVACQRPCTHRMPAVGNTAG